MLGSRQLAAQAQASLPGLDGWRRQRQVQTVELGDVQRCHLLDLLHPSLHHHHTVAAVLHLQWDWRRIHGNLRKSFCPGLLLTRGFLFGCHVLKTWVFDLGFMLRLNRCLYRLDSNFYKVTHVFPGLVAQFFKLIVA